MQSPGISVEALRQKIIRARTTWLVAEIFEGLNLCQPAPPVPTEFTVLATDGSHIDVDRHRMVRCYLINIGTAVITYGKNPGASLTSHPRLFAEDADLFLTSPDGRKMQPVEGNLLGMKRSIEECQHLAALAAEQSDAGDCLALIDGTLILWGLEAYPEFVTELLVEKGLLPSLEKLEKLNTGEKRAALAGYISSPRGTDVINLLRVAICPYEVPDCDRDCPPGTDRKCEALGGLLDREVFGEMLSPGERSAVFISPSRIVREHYGNQQVFFFYLRVNDEIARIEIPKWVATDPELLKLTHALVYDQCQRGLGYPVALSEAHEQAVINGLEREKFWEIVANCCTAEHLPVTVSGKHFSKRTRWV